MQITSFSPLKNMRVATKMYLAFASLLVLLLLLFSVNYFGLKATVYNFQRITEASEVAVLLSDIDRKVVNLQKEVSVFALTRNSTNAERIHRMGEELETAIASAASLAQSEQSRHQFEQMQNNIATYLEYFASVQDERQIRSQLVEQSLLQNAEQVRLKLNQLASKQAEGGPKLNATRQAMATLANAQNSALQYLSDPDSTVADQALGLYKDTAEQIDALLAGEYLTANQAEIEALHTLQADAEQLEPSFLRTVQATRAYLYLVNVVMAGEAAEFSYHSKTLQRQSAAELAQITTATTERTDQSLRLSTLLSAAAVVLGILITMSLVNTIIEPITAITNTFRKLTHQQPVQAIPGLDRGDEIGEMAQAAELLRDQSAHTAALLAQTETLARDLELKAQELQKNNDDLDAFAYVASHDLKSPLRAISNVSQWVMEDAADVLPEQSREHLNILRDRVRRMESLLDDLLAYSRVNRSSAKLSLVNVEHMLNEVQQTIDWPQNMTLHLGDNLPVLETEPVTLCRAFMNLMTNAVKYRTQDEPQLTITCQEVTNAAGQEFYEFAFADNGIGIAEKYHDTVFQMFKRLHLNSEIEGTGMGLALVDKIVKSNGGTMRLESEEGQGATFLFTWPKTMTPPQDAADDIVEQPTSSQLAAEAISAAACDTATHAAAT